MASDAGVAAVGALLGRRRVPASLYFGAAHALAFALICYETAAVGDNNKSVPSGGHRPLTSRFYSSARYLCAFCTSGCRGR